MIEDRLNNRIVFFDDDDLYDYAVDPVWNLVDDESGKGKKYDWDFTPFFKDALASNAELVIRDQNSHALKDQMIGFKGCNKPITINYDMDWQLDEIEDSIKEEKKAERQLKKEMKKHICPEE